MDINSIDDVKELKALKAKIERKIKSKKSKPKKKDNSALFTLIKDDHKRHVRPDGRKVFRSVVDYLECYVNGLPPIAKNAFNQRFGIESKRGKITPDVIEAVKRALTEGKTLRQAAEDSGISIASCQKIKNGAYGN
jgi:hypothetical protein